MSMEGIRELRERTGAGLSDCQKAWKASGGDIDKAIKALRESGAAKAAKKSTRQATDGVVSSYIHPGGRVGVLIEVNCETDFAARTDEFQQLVRDLAMQVAASAPRFVQREEVSPAEIDAEREIHRAQALKSGKPEKVLDRIVDGQIEKYFQEACLLEQPFVKDPDKKVGDLVKDAVARLGVNVVVRRFSRFVLGETVKESSAGGDAGD
jgi:elongation factor Ts